MKKIKNTLRKQLVITSISIFLVVLLIITMSYSAFTDTSKSEAYNTLQVGTLQISYVDAGDGLGDVLSLTDSFPISDQAGQESAPYRFDVQNKGSSPMFYQIKIIEDEAIVLVDECSSKQISKDSLKYQFDLGESLLLSSSESSEYIVYSGTLSAGSSRIHEVRMWIDEVSGKASFGKHFHGKVVVEAISDKGIIPLSTLPVKN